jgi:SAM-dependent methyltransferase
MSRFSDRVADYVKYRPTYPRAAAEAIIAGLGESATLTIADIGAGTGIFSRVLASTGARVIAIEPNADMLAAAEHDASNSGLSINWRSGTAEATGLESESVHAVTCAQAFHWFRPTEALAEFARILRQGGRIALVWNDRDTRDAFSRGYSELIEIASDGHAAANDHTRPQALFECALFGNPREITFGHTQRLDLSGLIGRATSASYIPKNGPKLETLKQGLKELFERHQQGGWIQLSYITRVFLAERQAGNA